MAARDPAELPKATPRRGPRALARSLRDLSHLPGGLALARLGYDLKRPVFALPIYRYSLTGAAPTAIAATPPDPWPGDAGRGAEIIQGVPEESSAHVNRIFRMFCLGTFMGRPGFPEVSAAFRKCFCPAGHGQ
jgi:hypothetical protein